MVDGSYLGSDRAGAAARTDRVEGHSTATLRTEEGGRETPDQRQRWWWEAGGSRVGNIRVIRCCFNPGHARVLRPITVRPGRARGLGQPGPGVARGRPRARGGPGPGLALPACVVKEWEAAECAGPTVPARPGPPAHHCSRAGSAPPVARPWRVSVAARRVRQGGLGTTGPARSSPCPHECLPRSQRADFVMPCAGRRRLPASPRRARKTDGLRQRRAVLGLAAATPDEVTCPVGHGDRLPRGSFCCSPGDAGSRPAGTAPSTFSRPQAEGDFLFQFSVSVL